MSATSLVNLQNIKIQDVMAVIQTQVSKYVSSLKPSIVSKTEYWNNRVQLSEVCMETMNRVNPFLNIFKYMVNEKSQSCNYVQNSFKCFVI